MYIDMGCVVLAGAYIQHGHTELHPCTYCVLHVQRSGGSRFGSAGMPSLKTFPIEFVDLTLSQEYMMCFISLDCFTTKMHHFSILLPGITQNQSKYKQKKNNSYFGGGVMAPMAPPLDPPLRVGGRNLQIHGYSQSTTFTYIQL